MTAAQLRQVKDPVERTRRALAAETTYRDEIGEIRQVRDEGIAEMRRQGLGYDRIAAALGISKARVQQLVKKA